ncbi:hypothetical protein AMS68_000700 [Peltaster fructicola]|uniref:F-box domain-containing protein n=1 Tax=Peltaster fructicola TaxID=286661 RepID=A0A6H0XKD2_9PEZI|nr:hypothetical protein AMS68_000700 [Peltaster fructicola]
MAAQDRVLNTSELLDLIVAELDWRTALRAQRVSRRWHDVIRSGNDIQHKLGLKSIKKTSRWSLRWNSSGMFVGASKITDGQTEPKDINELITTCCCATHVFAGFAQLTLRRLYHHEHGNEYVFKLDMIPQVLMKHDNLASWRNMQVTQPPTKAIRVGTVIHFRDALMYRIIPGRWLDLLFTCEDGVKLGDVIDLVQQGIEAAAEDVDWSNERFTVRTIHMMDDIGYLHALRRMSNGDTV